MMVLSLARRRMNVAHWSGLEVRDLLRAMHIAQSTSERTAGAGWLVLALPFPATSMDPLP